jgi:hypothetical protein
LSTIFSENREPLIGSWPEGRLFAILFQPSTPRPLQPELSARALRMFFAHDSCARGPQSP